MAKIKPSVPVLNLKHPSTFFERGGQSTHNLARKNTLAFTNSPTWAQNIHGSAVNFNGAAATGAYIAVPTTGFHATQMSFQIIYMARTSGAGTSGRLYDDGTACSAQALPATNRILFSFIWTTGTVIFTSADNAITPNIYNNIIVTYDGSAAGNNPSVWLNGSPVANTNGSNNAATSFRTFGSTLYLGNRSGADRTFDGHLALFRKWNRVLPRSEVSALSADPWCIYRKSLVKRLGKGSNVFVNTGS
jgi:hypothetical protein